MGGRGCGGAYSSNKGSRSSGLIAVRSIFATHTVEKMDRVEQAAPSVLALLLQ
jgi:hypothetical protein